MLLPWGHLSRAQTVTPLPLLLRVCSIASWCLVHQQFAVWTKEGVMEDGEVAPVLRRAASVFLTLSCLPFYHDTSLKLMEMFQVFAPLSPW